MLSEYPYTPYTQTALTCTDHCTVEIWRLSLANLVPCDESIDVNAVCAQRTGCQRKWHQSFCGGGLAETDWISHKTSYLWISQNRIEVFFLIANLSWSLMTSYRALVMGKSLNIQRCKNYKINKVCRMLCCKIRVWNSALSASCPILPVWGAVGFLVFSVLGPETWRQ